MKSLKSRQNIPVKWLVALLAVALLYGWLQPTLNERLGWNLPSIADLTEEHRNRSDGDEKRNDAPKSSGSESVAGPETSPAVARHGDDPLDYLESIGNQTFRSPAGLVYRRGSAEGHRLKHLERHLENDPGRPGPHGVFDGSMKEFLVKIDETYQRAGRKETGTQSYSDEGRTIYEASFARELGYLGGQEGQRRKNPKLKRIRLVVDGDAVVTAFPF